MLLKPALVERSVDLQKKSYALLRWVTDLVDRGCMQFKTAHQVASLPEAAHHWLATNYETLPSTVQPERDDLRAFANLFASYLESSFDLVEAPGHQKYSPAHHCFCPICSWMVAAPRLRTKQLTRHDKKRARDLQCAAIARVALDRDLATIEPELLLETNFEAAALVAYGLDLDARMNDAGAGPASLGLWRAFAWTRQGSPKHGFELTPQLILDAESTLVQALRKDTT